MPRWRCVLGRVLERKEVLHIERKRCFTSYRIASHRKRERQLQARTPVAALLPAHERFPTFPRSTSL